MLELVFTVVCGVMAAFAEAYPKQNHFKILEQAFQSCQTLKNTTNNKNDWRNIKVYNHSTAVRYVTNQGRKIFILTTSLEVTLEKMKSLEVTLEKMKDSEARLSEKHTM